MSVIHQRPLEPTSRVLPCCGGNLDEMPIDTAQTTLAREVTCKPDELSDLEMSPILAALVDSIRGPRRPILIAKLREIKATKRTIPGVANELLEAAGLNARFDQPDDVPHGEPGHACIPPEVLMQVQDSLGNVIRIVEGHKKTLEDAGYPEQVVYSMIANLHAVLLQRML